MYMSVECNTCMNNAYHDCSLSRRCGTPLAAFCLSYGKPVCPTPVRVGSLRSVPLTDFAAFTPQPLGQIWCRRDRLDLVWEEVNAMQEVIEHSELHEHRWTPLT